MFIKQSESTAARRTFYFTATNTADGSAYTGALSGADLKISKAGGAEVSSAGTATHIATGLFKYEATAGECDTLGELCLRVAKAGLYNDVRVKTVVPWDPYNASSLGLTNLDAAISTRLPTSSYQDLNTILDAASTVETDLTLRGFFRLAAAVLFGKSAGAGTGAEMFRAAVADHKVRVTGTISNNNRTSVTTDQT